MDMVASELSMQIVLQVIISMEQLVWWPLILFAVQVTGMDLHVFLLLEEIVLLDLIGMDQNVYQQLLQIVLVARQWSMETVFHLHKLDVIKALGMEMLV